MWPIDKYIRWTSEAVDELGDGRRGLRPVLNLGVVDHLALDRREEALARRIRSVTRVP